jgi:general nucleoside transport system permease protein
MAAEAPAVAPPRARPEWLETFTTQALALVGAFLFAAVAGGIIIALYGENPLFVYSTVWQFSTARPQDFAKVLENATPLIFSGLAVAVAFRAGLFNIGVEGQYFVAMITATAAAIFLDFLPGPIHLLAVLLAAMAGSTAWAAVPAVLKVKTGAHEVVTTIMMNGIAISFLAWALNDPLRTSETGFLDLRSDRFPESALVPRLADTFGLEEIPSSVYLSWLFPLAIVACILVWFMLHRTRLGYEVRAVGMSPGTAEAGGISIGATQIKVFLISGALAGFVGLNHLLVDAGFLGVNYETLLGFTGIAVAFLGRNHPAGIFLAAILFGILARGEDGLAVSTELPREIVIILQGLLILSVVIAFEITRRILLRRRQRLVRAEEGAGSAAA